MGSVGVHPTNQVQVLFNLNLGAYFFLLQCHIVSPIFVECLFFIIGHYP